MVRNFINTVIIITNILVFIHSVTAQADALYFIDAHSQVDQMVVPLQTVISVMKKGGVTHTVLSTRGDLKGKALLKLKTQYPYQITPAVRTKGGGI